MGIFQLLARLGEAWAKEKDPILVHQEACTHARHRASTCSLCMEICPANAITERNGKVEIAPTCVDCGLCVSVCPTEALERRGETISDFYGRLRLAIQRGDDGVKSRERDQMGGQGCGEKNMCRELHWQMEQGGNDGEKTGRLDRRVILGGSRGGIHMKMRTTEDEPSASYRENARGGRRRLLVRCAKVPTLHPTPRSPGDEAARFDSVRRPALFSVHCLGEIEEAAIQLAMTEGVTEFLFAGGDCATCPLHRGGERYKERLNTWKRQFRTISFHHVVMGRREEEPSNEIGIGLWDPFRETEDGKAPHKMDRRTFFIEMMQESKSLAIKSIVGEKDSSPWQGGELMKTNLLRPGIRRQWEEVNGAFHDGGESGALFITDQCTDCGICAKVCPTDAIEIDREKGIRKIDPSRCVHCSLCLDICFRKAITLGDR